MKTCPDCGERVYKLGCVNCNEAAYIEEQEMLTHLMDDDRKTIDKQAVAKDSDGTERGC